MDYPEIEAAIFKLLDGSVSLSGALAEPPQVGHIPYKGARENFFLLINVIVKEGITERRQLVDICLVAAQLAIGSGYLTDQKAVEVSAFIAVPNREHPRRLFRIGISPHAYPAALLANGASLFAKTHDGITLQWPLLRPTKLLEPRSRERSSRNQSYSQSATPDALNNCAGSGDPAYNSVGRLPSGGADFRRSV